MDICQTYFCESGQKNNYNSENSKKVITHNVYNYVDCKWSSLVTEPCQDRYCDYFFHHLCQNDYDTKKFDDEFDYIHGVKKRCKSCVDKMMKSFDNILKISSNKEIKNHMTKKFINFLQITIHQKMFMIVI